MRPEPNEERARRGGRGRQRMATEHRTSEEQRAQIRAWFQGRLPEEWFAAGTEISVDDDEVLVVGTLGPVSLAGEPSAEDRVTAAAARIDGFREDTREHRMKIADEAQNTFGRVVSWGAACGDVRLLFTTASVPVMTRLRIAERQVLDTLIDAGMARSRSEALAWCVRLVGQNEQEWIDDLRAAFEHVEQVRSRGPRSAGGPGSADS